MGPARWSSDRLAKVPRFATSGVLACNWKRTAALEGPAFGRVLHLGPDAKRRSGSVDRRQACLARSGSRIPRETRPAWVAFRSGWRAGQTSHGNGSMPGTSSDGLGGWRVSLRTDQHHGSPEALGPWRPGDGRFSELWTSGCIFQEADGSTGRWPSGWRSGQGIFGCRDHRAKRLRSWSPGNWKLFGGFGS